MIFDRASWRAIAMLVVAVAGSVGAGVGVEAALGPPSARVGSIRGGAGVLIAGDGVVWAAANDDDVYRSTDDGLRWRATLPAAAYPSCGCFGPDYFIGANDAWTLHYRILAFGKAQVARLWRTTDGGRRWSEGAPLPDIVSPFGPGGVIDFFSVAFATSSVGYVLGYGSPPTGASPSALEVALWRTDDGGRRFQALPPLRLPMQAARVAPLTAGGDCGGDSTLGIAAVGARVLYLSSVGCPTRAPGLWRSADGGRHFTRVTLPGASTAADGVEVDPPVVLSPKRLLAEVATRPGHLLVFTSDDDGLTFRLASSLVTGQWARPSPLVAASASSWAVPVTDGLEVTRDAGAHWSREASGIDLASLGPLALAPGGVGFVTGFSLPDAVALRTTNWGLSWRPAGSTPSAVAGSAPYDQVDFTTQSTGYLGGLGGLAKTTDNGRRLTVELGATTEVTAISFLDATTGLVRTTDSVLVTRDAGARWSTISEPAQSPIDRVAFVAHTNELVASACAAGSRHGALYFSDDLGSTWIERDGAPGGCGLPCFTSPSIGYVAVAGTSRRLNPPTQIWRTTDGARSWHLSAVVRDSITLAGCRDATLYGEAGETVGMGGDIFAIYRSTDAGHHFAPVLGFDSSSLPIPGLNGRLPAGSHLTPLASPAGTLVSFSTVGASTLVVVSDCEPCEAPDPATGGSAALAISHDGGATWHDVPAGGHGVPYTSPVAAISTSFVDAEHGFVLGGTFDERTRRATSILVGTSDGGRHWSELASYPALG